MADKMLKQDALEKYEMNSLAAIVNQVTNGKNAMPAFKGKLNPTQIEDVATYVRRKPLLHPRQNRGLSRFSESD